MPRDRSADSQIHDYTAINKYIDEQARIRRTKSIWGYTRSIALILSALGLFALLIAIAYWMFNRPYDETSNQTQIESKQDEEVTQENIQELTDETENFEQELQNNLEKLNTLNSFDTIESLHQLILFYK